MGNSADIKSIVLAIEEGNEKHDIDFDADVNGSVGDLTKKCNEKLEIPVAQIKLVINGVECRDMAVQLSKLEVRDNSTVRLLIRDKEGAGGAGAGGAGM